MGLKVFLVFKGVEYEGEEVISVYLNESKAHEECLLLQSGGEARWGVYYYVEDKVVEDA